MFHNKSQIFKDKQLAEICGNFLKAITGNDAAKAWCIENGVGLTKATTESTNTAGGFLAPVDFDNSIISVVETFGAFRQGADIRPTGSDGQVRPRRTGGATANFVTEGAAIPESGLLLDAIESAQKKLGILLRSSSELFQDAAAILAAFLAFEIGYAFAGREDDCAFNGDGTSAFGGVTGLATKLVGL